MATLQFSDCSKPVILLRPSFTSLFANTRHRHWRTAPSRASTRFIPKASLQQFSLNRRRFIAETTAISLSLPQLVGFEQLARSEEALSEWERVYLPVDPGVVLLDIAFVPDDLNHGNFCSFTLLLWLIAVWLLTSEEVLENDGLQT